MAAVFPLKTDQSIRSQNIILGLFDEFFKYKIISLFSNTFALSIGVESFRLKFPILFFAKVQRI